MRVTTRFAFAIISAVAGATPLAAQGTYRLAVDPGSKIEIDGTSNVHNWECATTEFTSEITAGADYAKSGAAGARSLQSVTVTIPAKSIQCSKGGKMTDNLRKAIKADEFATITYKL